MEITSSTVRVTLPSLGYTLVAEVDQEDKRGGSGTLPNFAGDDRE